MKRILALPAATLLLVVASSGLTLAHAANPNGTATGTNTSTSQAGTGNAGDKTEEVGTTPAAPRNKSRRHAKSAASAASGG